MREGNRLINPFKPTAGMMPPVLAGRESVIDDFTDGLDEGPGAPARLMRITGPRGSGKTVLLNELGGLARRRGWTVIDVSGREEICSSIKDQLTHSPRLKGLGFKVSTSLFSAEAKLDDTLRDLSFRESYSDAARKLSEAGTGLLITVDEAQDASRDEMAVLATNVQYMIREGRDVGLLFAGITTGVFDLLNGDGLTFLRRAKPEELASIPLADVASALEATILESGLKIEKDALAKAAAATHGYAYLIQLIGYYVWREGRRHADESLEIGCADVEKGVERAIGDFEMAVLETALAGLTKPSVEYLLAMSADDGASSTSEVARRMGVPAANANTYRRVLIDRQIIESTAPGYVCYSIPFMRDYLVREKSKIMSRFGE